MTEPLPDIPTPVTTDPAPRRAPRSGTWVGGAVLILVGVVFLLQNVTGFNLDNWWALFILIPAFGSFDRGYRIYQSDGRLSGRARGHLLAGLGFVALTFFFLFGGLGSWWPLFLVGAGLMLLVNALLPD